MDKWHFVPDSGIQEITSSIPQGKLFHKGRSAGAQLLKRLPTHYVRFKEFEPISYRFGFDTDRVLVLVDLKINTSHRDVIEWAKDGRHIEVGSQQMPFMVKNVPLYLQDPKDRISLIILSHEYCRENILPVGMYIDFGHTSTACLIQPKTSSEERLPCMKSGRNTHARQLPPFEREENVDGGQFPQPLCPSSFYVVTDPWKNGEPADPPERVEQLFSRPTKNTFQSPGFWMAYCEAPKLMLGMLLNKRQIRYVPHDSADDLAPKAITSQKSVPGHVWSEIALKGMLTSIHHLMNRAHRDENLKFGVIDKVFVTAPAAFNIWMRRDLVWAASQALALSRPFFARNGATENEVPAEMLVDESHCVEYEAIAALLEANKKKQDSIRNYVLTFDCGGATTDVCLSNIEIKPHVAGASSETTVTRIFEESLFCAGNDLIWAVIVRTFVKIRDEFGLDLFPLLILSKVSRIQGKETECPVGLPLRLFRALTRTYSLDKASTACPGLSDYVQWLKEFGWPDNHLLDFQAEFLRNASAYGLEAIISASNSPSVDGVLPAFDFRRMLRTWPGKVRFESLLSKYVRLSGQGRQSQTDPGVHRLLLHPSGGFELITNCLPTDSDVPLLSGRAQKAIRLSQNEFNDLFNKRRVQESEELSALLDPLYELIERIKGIVQASQAASLKAELKIGTKRNPLLLAFSGSATRLPQLKDMLVKLLNVSSAKHAIHTTELNLKVQGTVLESREDSWERNKLHLVHGLARYEDDRGKHLVTIVRSGLGDVDYEIRESDPETGDVHTKRQDDLTVFTGEEWETCRRNLRQMSPESKREWIASLGADPKRSLELLRGLTDTLIDGDVMAALPFVFPPLELLERQAGPHSFEPFREHWRFLLQAMKKGLVPGKWRSIRATDRGYSGCMFPKGDPKGKLLSHKFLGRIYRAGERRDGEWKVLVGLIGSDILVFLDMRRPEDDHVMKWDDPETAPPDAPSDDYLQRLKVDAWPAEHNP